MQSLSLIPLTLVILMIAACSSDPTQNKAAAPEWINSPARTVDNGYIVYIGVGEDSAPERAQFKAEAAALSDLANECSFAPKGTRIEDRYQKTEGPLHEAYAKVAVEFPTCEEAKKAMDSDHIKTLANATMTEEIKRYQDMQGEAPDLEKVAANSGEPLNTNGLPASNGGGGTTVIHDDFQYFVVRQQVAYVKQSVILLPANASEAQVASSQSSLASLQAPTQRMVNYEGEHPILQKSPATWTAQQPHLRQVLRQINPPTKSSLTPPPRPQPMKKMAARQQGHPAKSSRRKSSKESKSGDPQFP